jgi:type VI secretion system secreted protein VgrG
MDQHFASVESQFGVDILNVKEKTAKSLDPTYAVDLQNPVSLCAHKLGLKLFAAKGKVEIQAQSDALDLFADKQLRVASASQDVLVSGKTRAAMASGGAALTIENGNVVFHCPGEFRIKAASFTFEGPAGLNLPLPVMPKSNLNAADDGYSLSH